MNDIEVFCQQTHPNNVLLHVLASFVGKVHYLLLITDGQDANERHRVLLSSANPPEQCFVVYLLLIADGR